MIITRTEITAYAHCAQQVTDGELAFDSGGVPAGLDRCEGYRQAEVAAIRETVQFTFGDAHQSGGLDPMDAMVSAIVERSVERLEYADPSDRACPFCGAPRELSEQQRPTYASLGGARGGPDVVFQDRKARRQQVEAQQVSASAAERQAVALEALAAGAGASPEVAALRAEIAELREQLNGNGNGHEQRPSDVKPRPARRTVT